MTKKFMESLKTKLSENRAESSVNLYMAKLQILNDNKPFRTLSFLTDYDSIIRSIQDKKPNTQVSYLTSILVALEHYPKYKDTKTKYSEQYEKLVKERKEKESSHQKSETEKESLIPVQELGEVRKSLRQKTESYDNQESLSKTEYNCYLQHMILELYTAIPPRRNQDYLYMFVVASKPETIDTNKNYLVLNERKFIFNKYKTFRIYGSQELAIPEELMNTIEKYLVRHPLLLTELEIPFLVNYKGKELDKVAGITRVLNKVFNKNIGCSALRHIFITDKFGNSVKDREETANAMAHSTNTQNKYIKL